MPVKPLRLGVFSSSLRRLALVSDPAGAGGGIQHLCPSEDSIAKPPHVGLQVPKAGQCLPANAFAVKVDEARSGHQDGDSVTAWGVDGWAFRSTVG